MKIVGAVAHVNILNEVGSVGTNAPTQKLIHEVAILSLRIASALPIPPATRRRPWKRGMPLVAANKDREGYEEAHQPV